MADIEAPDDIWQAWLDVREAGEDLAIEAQEAIEELKAFCWDATEENLGLRNALLGLRGAVSRWRIQYDGSDGEHGPRP